MVYREEDVKALCMQCDGAQQRRLCNMHRLSLSQPPEEDLHHALEIRRAHSPRFCDLYALTCIYLTMDNTKNQKKESYTLQSHQNTAESVFARVLQHAQANGSTNVSRQQWLKQKTTIFDVQEEVRKVQEKYNAQKQGRVRKWLSRFSAGVLNYGQILDVLVQHHPEYVSLVWGTTKLLFVV
jgi:ribosomal protein L22